jgi:hypothetical protein
LYAFESLEREGLTGYLLEIGQIVKEELQDFLTVRTKWVPAE